MSSSDYHEEAKRRRLDQTGPAAALSSQSTIASSATYSQSTSYLKNDSSDAPTPSTSALLYHMAISAHRQSHCHLQQAFIPTNVDIKANAGYSPVLASAGPSGVQRPFAGDDQAAQKGFALLLFALDLLWTGLKSNQLSDRERVAFTIEFGIIATKAARSHKRREIKVAFPTVDPESIIADASDVVNTSVGHRLFHETDC